MRVGGSKEVEQKQRFLHFPRAAELVEPPTHAWLSNGQLFPHHVRG